MSSRSIAIAAVLLAAATSPGLAGGESACSRIEFRRDESLALAHHRGSLADAYGAEVAAIRDGERAVVARGPSITPCLVEMFERENGFWAIWFIKRVDPARAHQLLAEYSTRSDLRDLEVLAAAREYGPEEKDLIVPRVQAILLHGSVGLSGDALRALSFLDARGAIPAIRSWLLSHPTLPAHLVQNRELASQTILRLEGRAEALYEAAACSRPQGGPLWLLRDMGRWDLIERLSREAATPVVRSQAMDFLRARVN